MPGRIAIYKFISRRIFRRHLTNRAQRDSNRSRIKLMNKSKKIIIGIVAGGLAVLIIAIGVVTAKLDTIVEHGVETVGPKLTKTSIGLDKVAIGLLSGSGEVDGLVVGTPEGFNAEYTMKVAHTHLALKPASLLSDKIVIDKIVIESPEIILEGGLKDNNLTALQKNVTAAAGGGGAAAPASTEPAGEQKKLQVNHFELTGAKVHLRLSMLAGKNVTITAPDVMLQDLGTGPEGITSGELVKRALDAMTADILTAAAKAVGELGKEAVDAAGKAAAGAADAAGKETKEALDNTTSGIKNLFKKKE